jgi:hypothetical protein
MEDVKDAAAKKNRHWVAPRSNKRIAVWIGASSFFAAVMFQEEIGNFCTAISNQFQSDKEKSSK